MAVDEACSIASCFPLLGRSYFTSSLDGRLIFPPFQYHFQLRNDHLLDRDLRLFPVGCPVDSGGMELLRGRIIY